MPDLTPQGIVDFLNTLVALDATTMTNLVEARVPCSAVIRDHPTVQVAANPAGPGYCVGLLGILNGLVAPARVGVRVSSQDTIEAFWLLSEAERVAIDLPMTEPV